MGKNPGGKPPAENPRANKLRVNDATAHHQLGKRGDDIIATKRWKSDPNAPQKSQK